MSPGIRSAAPPDSAALLALATAFVTSFVVEPDAFQQMFLAVLADPDARLVVAEQDG